MSEIDQLKTEINLIEYASTQGYELDRRESSTSSVVMRKPSDGDKIIITRGHDSHWIYFSVRNDNDNGTIIDFVQNRKALSFGYIRQELRPWIGKGGTAPKATITYATRDIKATTKDRQAVLKAFSQMKTAKKHKYLEEERLIPADILGSTRFVGKIKTQTDKYKNAIFPHNDKDGICGYEIKNKDFTGFSKHGAKGLWFSNITKTDNRLVMAETAIDALSVHVLNPNPHTRYCSIGGSLNPTQPELIKGAISKMPPDSEIVIATDADAGGRRLAEQITELAEETGREDITLTRAEPPAEGEDWNDQVKAKYAKPGISASFFGTVPSKKIARRA